MATVASIAARRAMAEAAIKDAVSALAEKHRIEVTDATYPVRDVELRRVMDLESVASNLGAIVESFAPAKKAPAKEEARAPEEVPADVAEAAAAVEEEPAAKPKAKPKAKKK